MIVYSVQKLAAYKLLREQCYLEGNIKFSLFPEEYKWMMKQMQKRIPNYTGEAAPIWVWERIVNRNERALFSKRTKGVILKLEIPEKDILWSSFEDWHDILNNGPITFDEVEWKDFERRNFPENAVKETWEKLFDMEWLASRLKKWAGSMEEHWLQGVTPRITIEQIMKVVRFVAK